jgi:hypothetical protein
VNQLHGASGETAGTGTSGDQTRTPEPTAADFAQRLAALAGTSIAAAQGSGRPPLTPEQRDVVRSAREWYGTRGSTRHTELLEAIDRAALVLIEAARRAVDAAWELYLRAATVAAAAFWVRQRARIPLERPQYESNRRRLAATRSTDPNVVAFLVADWELRALETESNRHNQAAYDAVLRLMDACGRRGDLTPTGVRRALRLMHASMLGQASMYLRQRNQGEALRLDSAPSSGRRATARSTEPRSRLAAPESALADALAWLLPRGVTSPLPPPGHERQRLIEDGTRAWRARRNSILRQSLSQPHPVQATVPEWLTTHLRESVLAVAPPDMQQILADASLPEPAQHELDDLCMWVCEFVIQGYPRPDADLRTGRRWPEPRWAGLVRWASSTTTDFARSGIRVRNQNPVTLMTRADHRIESYDIDVDRGVPIEVEAPEVLRLDQTVLGTDPGAPLGWYRRAQWRAPRRLVHIVSHLQQGWDSVAAGFFNYRPAAFAQAWNERVRVLRRPSDPPLPDEDQRALDEMLHQQQDAFRQCVWLMRNQVGTTGFRRSLIRLRQPDAGRLLAFLFFADVTAVQDPADLERAENHRLALGHTVEEWMGQHRPPGADALFVPDSVDAWRTLVNSMFNSTRRSSSARSMSGDWFRAAGGHTLSGPPLRPAPDARSLDALRQEIRRVFVTGTNDFLGNPPDEFLGAFLAYMNVVLPDPPPLRFPRAARPPTGPGNPGSDRRPAGQAPIPPAEATAPPRDGERVSPGDLSGSSVTIHHRYVRCALLNGNPAPEPATDLWVSVGYIHLQQVAQPSDSSGFLRDHDYCGEDRPIGLSGMTGNAAGPHIHFDLLIHRRQPEFGVRAVAYLAPLDFLLPDQPEPVPAHCRGPENDPCRQRATS